MKLCYGVDSPLFTSIQYNYTIESRDLNHVERNAGTAHVPVIFGNTVNERASQIIGPSNSIRTGFDGIQETLCISAAQALRMLDSGILSYHLK